MVNGKDRSGIYHYDKKALKSPLRVEKGLMLATALDPEVAREQTDLSEEELDEALDAKKMTGT